ncbi:MAG: YceI family protein [Bacteroidetes bacterium]|nr:MAG: YceI family protein [Bacteroidota bacterium]
MFWICYSCTFAVSICLRLMLTRSRFLLAILLPVFVVSTAAAQTTMSVAPESVLTITGRSNESDWDVSSTVIEGELTLGDVTDALSVNALTISVPAAEIEAPRGLIMDRIMQGSLKSDEYPTITFELTSVELPAVPNDSLNLVAHGKFTLTGTTKDVSIDMFAKTTEDGGWHYKGSFPLTMTDYGMETPTVMFGQLRVHRDVVILFDLLFSK